MKKELSVADIKKAVKLLKETEVKPRWYFQWKWPFVYRGWKMEFYRYSAGEEIDKFIRNELKTKKK